MARRSAQARGVADVQSNESMGYSSNLFYEFIKAHSHEYDIMTMCRVLDVARAGYYAWLRKRCPTGPRKMRGCCG